MKTFDERRKSVEENIAKIKKSRRKAMITVTSLCLVVAVLAVVLFLPYDTTPPSMEKYKSNDYYDLIQKINLATYQEPEYQNRFDELMDNLDFGAAIAPGKAQDNVNMQGTMAGYPNGDTSGAVGEYVEVTDNQVAGVIEADRFKRSDKYLYYLRNGVISVYSIAKDQSCLVGSYELPYYNRALNENGSDFTYTGTAEMYLSPDCTTVTIVTQIYYKGTGTRTELISLDVTNPSNIRETNRVCMTGSYVSSRMVDGELLVMTRYHISADKVNFDDPASYVPQVGKQDDMELVAPEDIESPEELSHLTYTVVSVMDGKLLDVKDTAAFLSYSDQLYVSSDTIYATRTFTYTTEKGADDCVSQLTMTEISGIRYAEGQLEFVGSVTLDGSVKDQYSMDQYNGILRVVTSTFTRTYKEYSDKYTSGMSILSSEKNVNLYCVDLENWEVAASVIGFAPKGEDAQSVRFDGDKAYVCTAEVIVITDPVYFFDLSDLSNITWTDTGTIDGYSTSLIQLGNGYLMGVGYGDSLQLKIEVYKEMEGKVVSVCAYELDAQFSEDYKTYYIDRENGLIGLPTVQNGGKSVYVLLHFDGYELHEVMHRSYSGHQDIVRATIIDGWLYILSRDFGVYPVFGSKN